MSAEPEPLWCSNCNDEHSVDESCSDNAKRYDGPTVQFWEDGAKHRVTDLPGWREHPECVYDNGKPLAHLHGLSEQSPHTHYPVKAWGEAVPLTGGSPPNPPEATGSSAPCPSGDTDCTVDCGRCKGGTR